MVSDSLKKRIETLVDKRLDNLQQDILNVPLPLYLLHDYLKRHLVIANFPTFMESLKTKCKEVFQITFSQTTELEKKVIDIVKATLHNTVLEYLERIVADVNNQ